MELQMNEEKQTSLFPFNATFTNIKTYLPTVTSGEYFK